MFVYLSFSVEKNPKCIVLEIQSSGGLLCAVGAVHFYKIFAPHIHNVFLSSV